MKKDKGAISLFALLAMMFFLIFIMIAYNNVAVKAKTQVETTGVLEDLYSSDETASSIYSQELYGGSLTSSVTGKSSSETSKISSITSGQYIFIKGKIYKK
jgi:hypothetical protein